MQNLDNFINERELLLDEGFNDIVKSAGNIALKLKGKIEQTLSGLNYERKETVEMMKTFMLLLKDKLKGTEHVTDEVVQKAIFQLQQVGKLAAIAPLFALPGGGPITAVIYMLGKKYFDISILPKGLESVFESIQNIQEAKEQLEKLETLQKL